MTDSTRGELEARLGYRFANPELLELALRHASVADARVRSNERLEFLGDAVLGLIVCQRVYELFPDLLEGEMTKIKSLVVSRQSCAQIGNEIGLTRYLQLGKGMKPGAPTSTGAPVAGSGLPMSLSAAALEAVVAAMYLDAGPERGLGVARAFLLPLLESRIRSAAASGHQENFKSILQHHVQQQEPGQSTGQSRADADAGASGSVAAAPLYVVLAQRGPDHAKHFQIAVRVAGRTFEPAWGASKKQAEQAAALNALRELGLISGTLEGGLEMRVPAEPRRPKSDAGHEPPLAG